MALKSLNCREVGLRLQSYLDGEANPLYSVDIEEHLDDCVECGLDADVFRKIKAELSDQASTVDPAVIDRLRQFSDEIVERSDLADR